MAVSRDTPVEAQSEPRRSLVDLLMSLSRHDLVLAVIPIAFLVSTLVATVTSLTVHGAIVVASFAGALVVVDALFVHPPRGGAES